MFYVTLNGDDMNGSGTAQAPFRTIPHAMSMCVDASYDNRYFIAVGPGDYTESINWVPWTFLCGSTPMGTRINGQVTLNDAGWAIGGAHSDIRAGAMHVSFRNKMTFDFDAQQSDYGKFYLWDCWSNCQLTIIGHNALNQVLIYGCALFAGIVMSGVNMTLSNVQVFGGDITVLSSALAVAQLNASGGFCNGNVSMTSDATGAVQLGSLLGFSIQGSIALSGSQVSLAASIESLPNAANVQVLDGASLTYLSDASALGYLPGTVAAEAWESQPITTQLAIDRLAIAIFACNGGVQL